MIRNGSREVMTVAGSRDAGSNDGAAVTAGFRYPQKVTLDEHGHVLITDGNAQCLRVLRMDMPWSFLRVLYIGLLKGHVHSPSAAAQPSKDLALRGAADEASAARPECLLALLPVEGVKGMTCPILNRIIHFVEF